MTIDAIGVTSSATSSALTSSTSTLGQKDFLNILLTQLRFQDPLKPVDNQAFIAQLAQFSALEINRQQSDSVNTLLSVESNSQSINLLGKSVEVATSSGSVVGTVSAVSVANGTPSLTVVTSGSTLTNVSPSRISLIRTVQGN